MNRILYYGFILSVLLLVLAYSKGFRSNVEIMGGAVNKLILTLTGRDDQGKFSPYPDGSV